MGDGRQVSARLRPREKSWQSWPRKRWGPGGSPTALGLRGREIPIWETGDLSSETCEWIPREDPAQGSQWSPHHQAEDLGVDPRSGSGTGGLRSHSISSLGVAGVGDWRLGASRIPTPCSSPAPSACPSLGNGFREEIWWPGAGGSPEIGYPAWSG